MTHNAKVSQQQPGIGTVMHMLAAAVGRVTDPLLCDVISMLWSADSLSVDAQFVGGSSSSSDALHSGATPLHVAATLNNLAATRALLSRGANVDATSERGSPLHVAIACRAFDVAIELVTRGANLDLLASVHVPSPHSSPLSSWSTSIASSTSLASTSLSSDDNQQQQSPLQFALELALASKPHAIDDRRSLISFVLQALSTKQAIVNDDALVALVHLSCRIGVDCAPLVQWFVSNRPDLLAVQHGAVTPLYLCADRRQIELLVLMLQSKAVIESIDATSSASNGDQLTALSRAAQNIVDDDDDQSLSVVEILLDAGASTQLDNVLCGSRVWFHASLPSSLNLNSFRTLLRRYANKFDDAWLDQHISQTDKLAVFGD